MLIKCTCVCFFLSKENQQIKKRTHDKEIPHYNMIQAMKMTQKEKIGDTVTYETRKGHIYTIFLSKTSDKYNMIPRNMLK